ncbi:MAG TPA: DEAD/DEAH box helicase, partial [Chthoniobacteraceae bacterium]
MIPLNERLLADAGGWQALKHARSLQEMGRVISAAYAPPLLEGRVREGETEYRSGLRIASKSNIENLCGCRPSRQFGTICAHSLAVGLEVLKPRQVPVTAAPAPAAAPVAAVAPAPARPYFATEGDGAPVQLFIILAPNFAAGWEKNAITFGVEGAVNGRRVLLSALDKARQYRCDAHDLALVETLRAQLGGELPGMALLPREVFLGILPALTGHPRVTFGKSTAVNVSPDGIPTDATLPSDALILTAGAHAWIFHGDTFSPIRAAAAAAAAPATPAAVASSPGAPPAKFLLQIEGSLNHLAAELQVRYGEQLFTVETTRPRRNPAAEEAALARLRAAGFSGPDAKCQLILKGEPAILSFFAQELPRLQRDWEVTIGSRFTHVTKEIERIEPRLEIRSSGENWFDLSVELGTSGGERFSAQDIQRLLQSGQSSLRLKNRKIAVFDPHFLDEFQQVLADCQPQQRQPGLYRLDQRNAAYLQSVATEHSVQLEGPPAWKSLAEAAANPEKLRAIPLGPLEEVLRPYQKQGVAWLCFLAQNGLGGVLADEMGLGKTLQALAMLRAIGGKALIVCPSSLLHNWQREATRFTPDRRVLLIQGPDRQGSFGRIAEADLVITSYPLLRRDVDRYRGLQFDAMILDEAQHIKNPESQNAQSAQVIRARHRFVLTGTPVENSIRDLWSLMNFTMPGFLGERKDFKERYEQPIQTTPSGLEHRRLVHRIRPYILRRLKRNVATELPDKIQQVAYAELSAEQRQIYSGLLDTTRRQVSELAGGKDRQKARMLVLTALLRLRQACCDLRLLNLAESSSDRSSGKVELFEELLQEAIDGGHRVLVFSQFVQMLHLLRTQLEGSETPFCYLDGSTKNRQAEVD